ncbi:ISAs1 family transposase [Bradyrhizobium sp.]|jgi:predicted transposase YbfD/YdcC|uniref:ISAs1 family transposase n=1 Tax=Bradyrhizobium sp. TaxID=376 RepID=UPI003C23A213
METVLAKPRLRLLLDHLGAIKDTRQSWKVAYPLREVLFLVVCGTIASGDDYDDIVDWGKAHLSLLQRFSEFHFGIPCADWLRTVMNRIDTELFAACFSSWAAECWPDKPGLVAIDGKTSRRSHDRKREQKALHLVSAFATTHRLVLGQEATEEKSNEITAIPALVERINLEGALVSIDAMGCNPNIAQSILDAKADYLLAVKDNQPTLHAEIKSYFDTAPSDKVERSQTTEKGHGRLEIRSHTVSHEVEWTAPERSYPGAFRFPKLTTIAMVESRIERGDKIETERRSYISSRILSAVAFADAVRSHWAIENNLHWTLDMTFNEDQSRLRVGNGAKNMAIVRHFALNLVRQAGDKRSIKRRRKCASWDPDYMFQILGVRRC